MATHRIIIGAMDPTLASQVAQTRPFFDDKNRAFWQLQIMGWGGYLVLRAASAVSSGAKADIYLSLLFQVATGFSLTLLLAVVFRAVINRARTITAVVSLLAILICVMLYAFIDAWMLATIRQTDANFEVANLLAFLTIDFTILAAWSALYYAINFYLIVEDQVEQLERLESQATSAQLAMLRYQLNPHFLFNTLNSISTLVLLKQTERASAMLNRLSSFLRFTLANEPTAKVTLEQEVETLKLYLEIEKMRFEDRLRPSFDIEPAVAKTRIPSLLLQPLVENAIKYAVTPQEDGADIAVSARLIGNQVEILVVDTGPGVQDGRQIQSHSTGVGLANIRDRLFQAYGEDQRFDAGPGRSGGYMVSIRIPYEVEHQARLAA